MARELSPWQQSFVDEFLTRPPGNNLLVAPTGSGKTTVALLAADRLLKAGRVDSVLSLSDRAMRGEWSDAAEHKGIDLQRSLCESLEEYGVYGAVHGADGFTANESIEDAARRGRWLIIADDPLYQSSFVGSLVDKMLLLSPKSTSLFISTNVLGGSPFDHGFRFPHETILDRSIIESPQTELQIVRYAPSFSLLRRSRDVLASIDDMTWREFEKFISTLLEKEGYAVELMRGSKDGGVDVVATMDLGASGSFKAIWQAKKPTSSRKVGISVVRELADTRLEFGASKAIIVTSSYLTRGALDRIDRDRYLLGKVDRDDLDVWAQRVLFGQDA